MKLKSLISPSYNMLLAAGSLLGVVSFFWKEKVDFHLNDTFIVVSGVYFIWAAAILFVSFWLIYRVSCKILLSPALTWVHVLSTLFGVAVFFAFPNFAVPQPVVTDRSIFYSYNMVMVYSRNIAFLVLLFLAGQAVFAINIAFGLVKYLSSRAKRN